MEFVQPRSTSKAPPDRFMEHIAMWEATADGSPETTWAEPVTEQRYNAPAPPAPSHPGPPPRWAVPAASTACEER